MKKLSSQKVWTVVKGYFFVTVAGLLNAVSLFTFVNPATLVAGGFSGLSSALSYIFVLLVDLDYDTIMSIAYFAFNVPLLICALIFLRGDFTFKTIWSTICCTLALKFLPPQFKFHAATNARLICIIFGGILIGISMYLAAEYNGSNGGTEIIARIVSKYHPEIDLSKVIMLANFVITVSGSIIVMIVQGENFGVILYSIMYVIIGAGVMGIMRRGINHPQKFLIITTAYEEICQDITKNFQRGFSIMDVENSNDGQQRKMISVIVQFRQMNVLKQIIRKHDPNAFTIVKDVHDIFSRPDFNRSYRIK